MLFEIIRKARFRADRQTDVLVHMKRDDFRPVDAGLRDERRERFVLRGRGRENNARFSPSGNSGSNRFRGRFAGSDAKFRAVGRDVNREQVFLKYHDSFP